MTPYGTLFLLLTDGSGTKGGRKPLSSGVLPQNPRHPDTQCFQLLACQKERVISPWFERLIRPRSIPRRLQMTCNTEEAGTIAFSETYWLNLSEPSNPPKIQHHDFNLFL